MLKLILIIYKRLSRSKPSIILEKRTKMKIKSMAIGSDHSGVALKAFIRGGLEKIGIKVLDCGTNSEESVDYPDIAKATCAKIIAGEADSGILICGTGIGICISANKVKGVRAAQVSDEYSAKMAKKHNDANVICLGARTIGPDLAWDIVKAYLQEDFEGGRHNRRLDKIRELEEN